MLHRLSRIRRVIFLVMLYVCSFAAVGLLIIYFGTQRLSWERAIATDPEGWPWSFRSPVIDPKTKPDQEWCSHWNSFEISGWRIGAFSGSLILGRNRSLPQPATKEIHFIKYNIQVAHGTVHGPYYSFHSTHLGSGCSDWKSTTAFSFRTDQGRVLNTVNTTIIFPAWYPVPFLAIVPIWYLLTGPLRTFRRRRKGLCIHCAYDLTGNTSGTCPECGNALKS